MPRAWLRTQFIRVLNSQLGHPLPSSGSKVNPAMVQLQSVAKEFLLAPGPQQH